MSEPASVATKTAGGPDPLIGRSINDRFKITGLIARGGMGKVYRAEQAPLGRACALKVLNPSYMGDHDPEFHKRFFLEASIASKLTHPNTVTIFDYGRTDDEIYYMAMEYLDGKTLHRAIREASPFPEERAAHIARQVCRSLREAHALGVIHRDLKPANIFLVEHGDESDFVKVLDFGLVKSVKDGTGEDLTQTGLFMGSPKYMAPEQIRGERVDARTDIYALGIILYEMLCGKVPFDRSNSVNILMAHVNEEPPPLREMNPSIVLSPQIEDVVARCLAKDVTHRYTTMDELLSALKRVGAGAMTGTVSGVGTGEYRSLERPSSHQHIPVTARPPSASGSQPGVVAAAAAPASLTPSGPLLQAGVTTLDYPPRRGSKTVVALSVFGIAAVCATIAYVGLVRPPAANGTTNAAGPVTTNTAATTTTAPDPTPPPPAEAKVRIITEPEGATVKEDGQELCKSTPCDVTFKGDAADPSKDHKLVITRAGFKSDTRTIKVGDSPVSLKLVKDGPVRFGPVPGPKPDKPDNPPVGPNYKDIPY